MTVDKHTGCESAGTGETSAGLVAVMYPDPTGHLLAPDGISWSDAFEVHDANSVLLHNDSETRSHPEVPLTLAQRDAVLDRLGYRRTGPWREESDGRAEAPVHALSEAQ